jgi:hypothetical protein
VLRKKRDHSSSIDIICGNARWLGDDEPIWIEGKKKRWERPCKTYAQARQLRDDAVRLLQRHAKSCPAADALAERLDGCSPQQPCASGACAVCNRAIQRWFVHNCDQLISGLIEAENTPDFLMATISPDFGQVPVENITPDTVHATVSKLRRLLRTAGIHIAVGGIDFSVNSDIGSKQHYVQVHACLFIPRSAWPHDDRQLRSAVNKSGVVARPINIKRFNGNKAGLAYALKYEFCRREQYTQLADSRRDKRRCTNTRIRPLQGNNWMSLLLLLDQVDLQSRVLLTGVKRIQRAQEVIMQLIE